MERYFSTFITGFQSVVPELLKELIPDVRVTSILDGIVVYETAVPEDTVRSLRLFNNSFVLVKEFGSPNVDLKEMYEWALSQEEFIRNVCSYFHEDSPSIRIVTTLANEMTSAYADYAKNTEKLICSGTKLRINGSHPDYEIWFYGRREGGGYIGIRITYHTDYKKILNKGELRPELAYLLCSLSCPRKEDVLLDPFCGSGAIPLQRARSFPYKNIIAGDIDTSQILSKIESSKQNLRNLKIMTIDASTLCGIKNSSISKIVTDPPWGVSAEVTSLDELYHSFLKVSLKKLIHGAKVVFLTSQKELTDQILNDMKTLYDIDKKFDILVSGKKARVYVLTMIQ